jgi:signal transduction histidine kinase
VVASGRPERLADISSSLRFALGELGVKARSAMFVPLQFRGKTLGLIEAFDRIDGPEFRAEDERMLLSAAVSAATAVATAQSVERERLRRTLRAAEEERRRWARELHDETLQGLGGLRMLLSSARRSNDLSTLQEAVEAAVSQLTEEIANLRSLISELRPATLDELGLEAALDALLERTGKANGLQISSTINLISDYGRLPKRLDPELETVVYRIVQECLTNVARHAEAERIAVEVVEHQNELRITVRDDGKGFDPAEPASGFGLTGMRERTSLAGGTLEIASSPDGTTITVNLPTAVAVRRIA